NWAKTWDTFKRNVELALEPLGKPMLEAFTNVVDSIKPLSGYLKTAVDWFTALPAWVKESTIALVALAPAVEIAVRGFELFASLLGGLKIVAITEALGPLVGTL